MLSLAYRLNWLITTSVGSLKLYRAVPRLAQSAVVFAVYQQRAEDGRLQCLGSFWDLPWLDCEMTDVWQEGGEGDHCPQGLRGVGVSWLTCRWAEGSVEIESPGKAKKWRAVIDDKRIGYDSYKPRICCLLASDAWKFLFYFFISA